MSECEHPFYGVPCGRVAKYQQRFGARRKLCGWHQKINSYKPVDRIPFVKTNHDSDKPKVSITEDLYERIHVWADERMVRLIEATDYLIRKALDREAA